MSGRRPPPPRVDFTNILCTAFRQADPKRAKRQSTQAAFFAFGI